MTAPETALALSREQIESIVHELRQISPHALLWGLMNLSAQALAAHDLADRIAALEAENRKLRTGSIGDELSEAHEAVFQNRRECVRLRELLAAKDARYQELEANCLTAQANWELTLKRAEAAEAASAAKDASIWEMAERCAELRAARDEAVRALEPFARAALFNLEGPWVTDKTTFILAVQGRTSDPVITGADLWRALSALPASETSP